MHGGPGIRILDPLRSPAPDPLSLCQEGINLIVTCFNVVVKIVLKQVTVSSIVYTGRWSSIIDSGTEECFLGGFGTSWNINFQRMSSQVIYFWSHVENDWLSTRSFPVKILFALNRSPRSLRCCSG